MAAYESHETPPSSSSSLCRPWRYDVYLSYHTVECGVHILVDYLREAMIEAGLRVYSGSENYLVAIEYSRVSVIIFSEYYAAESWCLGELAKIIECKTAFRQQVLPIIYKEGEVDTKVDIFPRLFEKLAALECQFDEEEILRWKGALSEAKKLPALEYTQGFNWNIKGEFIVSFFKSILKTLKEIQEYERRIVDDGANGRRIGKLLVSGTEIARGSNGTIVFEGTYSGRQVAVKRLLKAYHDVAFKEIQNLIESDEHQNIVRLYGEENDQDFVYLALQLCTCNLDDLIQSYLDNSQNTPFSDKYDKDRLDSVKDKIGDINLWKANGRPSPLLLELMRNMVAGLVHLHKMKIIHRDIKPQNVLIKIEPLLAKLSDMGISKRLDPNMSSLGPQATVCGSLGWRAPEQILGKPQTCAVDLFSLGCVLFFCITGGDHPFGDDPCECETKIRKKHEANLSTVKHIPEAVDLFSRLLNPDPQLRPEALQVLEHPLFWDSEKRLSFVWDTSNTVESEAWKPNSNLLTALENIKLLPFRAQWNTKMDKKFIDNMKHYRIYNFTCVRDLLRIMRNTRNHYRGLLDDVKAIVGSYPEGVDDYFASQFPNLLIKVWKVANDYCQGEEWFHKYF